MKAMLCKAYGPPESLVFEDHELPPPAADEVRLRVRAAGVNFPDILQVAGKYQFKPEFPFSPGSECAGDIIAVGEAVSDFKPGDRVIAMTGHGAFAEEANVRAVKCMPLPDDVSYKVGSAFILTYGTSLYALKQRAQLAAGEWLLVHGAAGGVGLSAVEIGKAMGAKVIGTASTDEKLKMVTEHGADAVINYAEGGFKDQVKEICGSAGADVIYDPVGGDTFDESLRCINWDGRLLVIGFASGRIAEAATNIILLKGCSVVGVAWGAFAKRDPATNSANIETLLGWYAKGELRPLISTTMRIDQATEALNALAARRVVGKMVLSGWAE